MIKSSKRAGWLTVSLCLLLLAACRPRTVARPAQTATPVLAGRAVDAAAAALVPSATPSATATATRPSPTATATPGSSLGLLKQTENILVMGIDRRPDEEKWNTDTIMVVAIDQANQRVGVVNIPRDLYVEIPGMGKGKVNQADHYGETEQYPGGGPALLGRVLMQTLDIPVQHYVRIKMEGLVRLVDALGGVTVTLDCPLYERTPNSHSPNGVVDWNLPAGSVQLDGMTAKKFATYRYVSSDFGRARRQQQLIWAIRDRALQTDILPRIPALWQALQDTFDTDLDVLDVMNLARLGAGLRSENVHGLVFSLDALTYDFSEEGSSILVVKDQDQVQNELGQLFAGRPLATLGESVTAGGDCPPAPTAVPTYTATPTVTPTPAVTATVTFSGTVTPTPTLTTTVAISGTVTPSAPLTPGAPAEAEPPSAVDQPPVPPVTPMSEPILAPPAALAPTDTPRPG